MQNQQAPVIETGITHVEFDLQNVSAAAQQYRNQTTTDDLDAYMRLLFNAYCDIKNVARMCDVNKDVADTLNLLTSTIDALL